MKLLESVFEYANALLNRAADLLRPSQCYHDSPLDWRPALYGRSPARICRYCKKIEFLTREEFYSRFGEAVYRRLVEAEREFK